MIYKLSGCVQYIMVMQRCHLISDRVHETILILRSLKRYFLYPKKSILNYGSQESALIYKFSLHLNRNIFVGTQRDSSFGNPNHMFILIGKKIFTILHSNILFTILSYGSTCN